MREKDIIAKFTILKQIEPRQEWVRLTKQRIMGVPIHERFGFIDIVSYPSFFRISNLSYLVRKPAFALAAFVLLLAGGVALQVTNQKLQNGLSLAEEEYQDTLASLELAQAQLEALKVAVEDNDTEKVSLAVKSFEERNAQASKDFVKLVENSSKKALQAGMKLVQLQKEKSQLERVLGTTLGEEKNEELENATKTLIEQELSDLENRTLTEEQQQLFAEAKAAYDDADYATALEKVWMLSQ